MDVTGGVASSYAEMVTTDDYAGSLVSARPHSVIPWQAVLKVKQLYFLFSVHVMINILYSYYNYYNEAHVYYCHESSIHQRDVRLQAAEARLTFKHVFWHFFSGGGGLIGIYKLKHWGRDREWVL